MTVTATPSFRCIICGALGVPREVSATVKGDRNGALHVVECPACLQVQVDPPEYSLDFYNEDGQVNFVVHNYGTPIEKIFDHSAVEAARRVERFGAYGLDLAAITDRPLRVLDIGGGYGFFGAAMLKAFPDLDLTVMEPSATRSEMGLSFLAKQPDAGAMPKFEVAMLDEDYAAANAGQFDIVTLWHVLEHVSDPVALLALANKLLRPGTGSLWIEVPNLNDELNGLSPAYKARNFMVEHISYFSPHTLGAIARRALPEASIEIRGYQRYGIFNYFHWIHFNAPQGADPDMFRGTDRWWLEATWRANREQMLTSDALVAIIRQS